MKAGRSKSADNTVTVGGHVGGGLRGAVKKALEIGAQTMQIFIGSPQTWREPSPLPEDLAGFTARVKEHALGPVFVHGSYLINLASSSQFNLQRSINNISLALRLADAAAARGLIIHPGSAGHASYNEALERVFKALQKILGNYHGQCRLLLEVCAGQGKTIGDNFSELADILSAMAYDRRLGICWDTCHLYNAGYDVATANGLERTIDEFDRLIGFEWLVAIHANDSKTPLGARKDRHENIGHGYIGEKGFRRMLHHPQLRPLPWILEVPGFERKGPDRENIQILKRLAR